MIPRRALSALSTVSGKGSFASSFVFDPRYRAHTGVMENGTNITQLQAVATNPDARITFVYFDTSGNQTGRSTPMRSGADGVLSADISLSETELTRVAIEVITPTSEASSGGVDWYHFSLRYQHIPLDQSDVPYAKIEFLEDMDAIRNNLSGSYVLTRHLDFDDDASYRNLANKAEWTVTDFDNSGDDGWRPIGDDTNRFTGTFDGSGYTISGLQINFDTNTNGLGLFSNIGNNGIVRDLGLLGVKIDAGNTVGALAGINRGTIIGSFAVGEITARANRVGGLVGTSQGASDLITNSYAVIDIEAVGGGSKSDYGGLVGNSTQDVRIINSRAHGTITGNINNAGGLLGSNFDTSQTKRIRNSYASVDIQANSNAGGLIGLSRSE